MNISFSLLGSKSRHLNSNLFGLCLFPLLFVAAVINWPDEGQDHGQQEEPIGHRKNDNAIPHLEENLKYVRLGLG